MQTPEGIANQIKSLYEADYQTHLTAVEGNWSADPITLYDFEDRRITIMPENLTVYYSTPALGIGVGNMQEVVGGGGPMQIQRAERFYTMEVRIVYYLKGIDDQELAKVVLRHIEATLLFFQAHPRFGLGNFFTVENIRVEPSANVFDSGGNMLVKGVRFRLDLTYAQRGP